MAATDGVQAWVSQLTALTSQKGNMSADAAKTARDDGEASLSKKPPQGLSRKRPGTGRKLPCVPTDKSPVSSEHSSYIGDRDLSVGDDVISFRTTDLLVNGRNDAGSSNGKPPKLSSQTRSRGSKNGYLDDGATAASPVTSARSRGSVDTGFLLQDTETAIAARVTYQTSHGKRNSRSHESDTDASSMVALVNGDQEYVKHKSPREVMAKRQQKDLSASAKPSKTCPLSTPPVSPVKKPTIGRSFSQSAASKPKTMASPRSTPSASSSKKSVVSDVLSRRDSMDNDSIVSDVSSEMDDSLSRSSKGKGAITMTKPNRAFQLRRARADSIEEPVTPKSAKSVAKSVSSTSSARSSSVHSNTRTRSLVDTNRSEATSLGAQIVKKSQQNTPHDRARRPSGAGAGRTDSNKQSQKLQRASSLTISQTVGANAPLGTSKREPTPKSHTRSTPTGKGSLTAAISSGFSSRSQSQPGSRSNSPKAAERIAWKRRKEYDPRRAVAEAKAKAKDVIGNGVTMRPKPSTSSNIKRRMIRSASFTNTAGMSLGARESVSISQDFSDRRGHFEQEDFRRAFLPFHNSLRADRSTHSADEDDSLASANSAQDTTKSLLSLALSSEPKSAFTPPLIRSKTESPYDTPSPQAVLRRKASCVEGYPGQLRVSSLANGEGADSGLSSVESPLQTSYDSLIVSSIYQLSLKLKTTTDKALNKLRDQNRVSHTPSPIDDFLSDSGKSEITAWKSANQELAGILKNLRKLERHVQMMNTVLFPEDEINSEVASGLPTGRPGKQKYFQEIERIRNELAGFHPIDHPQPDESDIASPEMAELSEQF